MALPATQVAKRMLAVARERGHHITPMKLQKLVYIAHGWYLASSNGKPLVADPVEAWRWGPVFPSIYSAYRHFGSGPISPPVTALTEDDTTHFLSEIWRIYGHLSATDLSAMTHVDGTPWKRSYRPGMNMLIPNRMIQAHYEEMLDEEDAEV